MLFLLVQVLPCVTVLQLQLRPELTNERPLETDTLELSRNPSTNSSILTARVSFFSWNIVNLTTNNRLLITRKNIFNVTICSLHI